MALDDDPLWYKDAIIYQTHVRAFKDSDADGVGDFKGLTEKLDYLHDLGVTAIWLLPFYPSPLKDDGYDIAEYTSVHPSYGTLADFKGFLREAHRRGVRVITELAINHTSDQHPWFQRARRAKPGSWARDYYVWHDTSDKYADARIIFKDFETSNWAWDPVAKAYYWHRFYSHQPDLNFENPRVRRAVSRVLDFWMRLGVDGMRLDAIPYLYEREGTNCENLPETHLLLKELRTHIDRHYHNRMLLAEANQWPEDSVAYFGDGDECHMNFHFPVMPRMFMSLQMEDRFPIIDILRQTPQIPDNAQWAMFLRNHDELTLEMVTDEERDYMYRVYAHDTQARINLGIRRRLAPLMSNNRRKLELMNGLLFALPGTPIIYYGDEIGIGDNIYLGDRNGVRTPMQWSPDRNAGFSLANPQKLYLPLIIDPEYHYEAINVEAQQRNPQSLLWWMKRLISLRKQHKAFGRGTISFVYPDNHKVLVFVRRFEEQTILVVANLSRFVQYAELDLSEYQGMVPVELFGRNEFPVIGGTPYFLTLGPHNFYWFALEQPRVGDVGGRLTEGDLPVLQATGGWEQIFAPDKKHGFESLLPAYLLPKRWFAGKAKKLKGMSVQEAVFLNGGAPPSALVFVDVEYADADTETYQLPLAFVTGETATAVRAERPQDAIATLRVIGKGEPVEGLLCEATALPDFCSALVAGMERRKTFRGSKGEALAATEGPFKQLRGDKALEPALLTGEQSNTSILYSSRFILKLFRRLESGINPELEIGRFLSEKRGLAHVPPVTGAIEYRKGKEPRVTLAILEGFVRNEGNAWDYSIDALGRYFEKALASFKAGHTPPQAPEPLIRLSEKETPPEVRALMDTFLDSAELLGTRTAEFHTALTLDPDDPAFNPEAFSTLYQRSIYQSMRNQVSQTFALLSKRLKRLPDDMRALADEVLAREDDIVAAFSNLMTAKFTATRIRCHGDYHLGQVLHTGKDFVIIDFEGEPMRSLSERRIKRSPLRDVAGMLRSFHYAAFTAAADTLRRGLAHREEQDVIEGYANLWYRWTAAAFLRAYLMTGASAGYLPRSRDESAVLVDVYLLDKAVYELGYELNHRPEWLGVPLRGILEYVRDKKETAWPKQK